jgi:uncharacterized membrane protein
VPSIVLDWLTFLLRWAHVIAAIMWIGDSLLFMWIDSHLSPDPQSRKDVAGVTWLLHAGGYYHLEKRLLVPGYVPPRLRWFWLEATSTWISGFLMLVLIYYMAADAFMVDRSVSSLTPGGAIAVGLGMLLGGWFLYDGVWRTAVGDRPLLALPLSCALLLGVTYAATHLLSARAAFIHVGALLGTIMAANVWVHILPPQRTMLQAAREGHEIDYSLGVLAKTRSTHNTYLTFPVIFLMISQHFPAVYVGRLNWVVLFLFVILGAGVRHLMLVGVRAARWTAVVTAAAAVALVFLTAPPAVRPPQGSVTEAGSAASAPSFVDVRTIIVRRCAVCHSATPTMSGVESAPQGILLDTPAQIRALASLIKAMAVDQRIMPPANATHITDEERAALGRWVESGAPLR